MDGLGWTLINNVLRVAYGLPFQKQMYHYEKTLHHPVQGPYFACWSFVLLSFWSFYGSALFCNLALAGAAPAWY